MEPRGTRAFMPKTPPMPLDSSGMALFLPHPQEDYLKDEKLTKIYEVTSSASRLQLNKLFPRRTTDVFKKVYNKRVGEENYDIEGSAEKIEILETDDKKETDEGEEGDDESKKIKRPWKSKFKWWNQKK